MSNFIHQNNRSRTRPSVRKLNGRRNRNKKGRGKARQALGYTVNNALLPATLTLMKEPFSGLPQMLSMKLIYFENGYDFGISASGTINTISVSLNDPWDPYTALGGKAANEFYDIMRQYKYCRTHAATVSVHVTQPDFASNRAVGMAMYPNWDGDTYPGGIDDVYSLDRSRVTICPQTTNIMGTAIKMKRRYTIPNVFNLHPNQYVTRPYSGLYDVYNSGSSFYSPTNLANLYIMVYRFNENSSSEAIQVSGSVQIIFEVEFAQKYPKGEYNPVTEQELKEISKIMRHDTPRDEEDTVIIDGITYKKVS